MSPLDARRTRASSSVPVVRPALVLGALSLAAAIRAAQQPTFRFEGAPLWHDLAPDAFPSWASYAGEACLPIDVDNDGDPDLVRLRASRLEIGRNTGGVLTPLSAYDPSLGGGTGFDYLPADAAQGDFDGDGFEDVALVGMRQAFPYQRVAQVLRNDRNGAFQPQPLETLPWADGPNPRVESADLDGDGRDDRVSWLLYGQEMHVLLSGAASGATLPLPTSTREVRLGDLDGDQRPDAVVLAVGFGGALHVRLNDGAGALAAAGPSFGSFDDPFALTLADWDQDGDLDALTTETEPAHGMPNFTDMLAFPGDGAGAFLAPFRSRLSDTWWAVYDIETGLLDGDAHLDVALCAASSRGVVATALGNGAGSFVHVRGVGVSTRDLAIVDLTRSGQPKLLTAEAGVVPVDGLGRVGPAALPPTLESLVLVATADFDGDSRADLLTLDTATNQVEYRRSDGEGGFAPAVVLGNTGPDAAYYLDAVDLDGDGRPDLAATTGVGVVALINAGGAPGPIRATPLPIACLQTLDFRPAFGDLDGDGAAELVLGDRRDKDGVLGINQGDGSFAFSCLVFPDYTGQIQLADMTGDARLDVVFVSRVDTGGTWILPGAGNGTFLPGVNDVFGLSLGIRTVVGDVDGDGDRDLVASREPGLAVLANDGTGHLALAQTVPSKWTYENLVLADLDEDGDLDLLAKHRAASATIELFASSGGAFASTTPMIDVVAYPWYPERATFRVADLDGDGLPDLAAAGNFPSNEVSNPAVYFNRTQLSADGVARAGESVRLLLREPRAAGRPYLVLGSRNGTQPGFPVPGDVLPLAFDPLLWSAFRDSAVFPGFAGRLDALGRARATFRVPPTLALPAPLPLDFAFLTLDAGQPRVIASNELPITLR